MVYYPGNEVKLPGFHRTAAERVRSISRVRFCSDARNGVLLPPHVGRCRAGLFASERLIFWKSLRKFPLFPHGGGIIAAPAANGMPGDLLTKNQKQNQASKRRCVPIGTNAKETQTLINEAIDVREVRVVDAEGQPLGIMSSREALRLAYDKDMDLVLIAPQAQPPVCKIMDYGKFRFEQLKKEKEAKKNQKVVEVKEIRMSPSIDTNDFNTKVKNAQKFLKDGNRVKVTVRFRGREMAHTSLGEQLLKQFGADCDEVATVAKGAKLEGRNMSMFLSPKNSK